MGKFGQCLTELRARDTLMAVYYSLMFLLCQHFNILHFFIPLTLDMEK